MPIHSHEEPNLQNTVVAGSKCKISTQQQSNGPDLNRSVVKVNITIPRRVKRAKGVLEPQGRVRFNLSQGSIVCDSKPLNLGPARLYAMMND